MFSGKKFSRTTILGTLLTGLLMLSAVPLLPAGAPKPKDSSGAKSDELYELGKTAADKEDFARALEYFKKARKVDPENPDLLNILAYSLRKTGEIDEAIKTYHKALELRPQFPEAREYLGEAYIQAALREIETLKSYGSEGEEQLEELVEAFKDAATAIEE